MAVKYMSHVTRPLLAVCLRRPACLAANFFWPTILFFPNPSASALSAILPGVPQYLSTVVSTSTSTPTQATFNPPAFFHSFLPSSFLIFRPPPTAGPPSNIESVYCICYCSVITYLVPPLHLVPPT
jgi:hypothetical protein